MRLSEQIGADGGRLSYTEALSSGRSTEAGLLTAIKFCFVLRRIERQALPSTLTRRQFASGSAAIIAGGAVGGLIGAAIARGRPERFTRPLPILPLIDATKQGNAVNLKVASGKHPFVGGKPVRCYGYSGHVLGPAIRLRRGDEVEMTVENDLTLTRQYTGTGFWCPATSMAVPIRSSSRTVHGVRGSRSISRHRPCGFIPTSTMTRRDRFTWGLRD